MHLDPSFCVLMFVSFVLQHMKHCLTVRGGRSMIRRGVTLSPERAHKEAEVLGSISHSASILRTCSETLIFSGSRHTPGMIKDILRATFKLTKRRTEAALRILSAATHSICFQTFSHSTATRSFTVPPTISAATQSLSAEETQ